LTLCMGTSVTDDKNYIKAIASNWKHLSLCFKSFNQFSLTAKQEKV